LAQLRTHAAGVLVEAGHPATEATLRRVSATLAALAAAGSFEPDPPGALTADRDPPGFDDAALSLASLSTAVPSARIDKLSEKPAQSGTPPDPSSAEIAQRKEREAEQARKHAEREAAEARKHAEREAAEARKRAERELEQRRLEEQRRAKRAERERLQSALKVAQHEAELAQRTRERLRGELAEAELAAERTRTHVNELTARLRSPELD
jgi:flagellar biosynthesis GTPase FlhF